MEVTASVVIKCTLNRRRAKRIRDKFGGGGENAFTFSFLVIFFFFISGRAVD